MKTTLILSAFLCSSLFVVSCKKEKDKTTGNNPEQMGPQPGKIVHYSFNGNVRDTSGNNLNATYLNNISFEADRFGRPNEAAVFGSGASYSSIAVPAVSSRLSGFPFAVSIWFKTMDPNSSQPILKADGGESNTTSGFWLQMGKVGPGKITFGFGDNTSINETAVNTITTPAIFSANTWYHIVVNVRGANDMDFYINGVKNNSCSYAGTATSMVFCTAGNQLVGAFGFHPGFNSALNGMLDDYRVYNKILSPQEINALYSFRP
jgi:Concanavalin A-like lectin/glucanases superfamily